MLFQTAAYRPLPFLSLIHISASITLDTDSYVYDGNPKKPCATVKLTDDKGKEKTLRLGTDYSIEYKDNTNAGEASVVVKGKGNYTGTCEKTFTISARSMSDSQLSLIHI